MATLEHVSDSVLIGNMIITRQYRNKTLVYSNRAVIYSNKAIKGLELTPLTNQHMTDHCNYTFVINSDFGSHLHYPFIYSSL